MVFHCLGGLRWQNTNFCSKAPGGFQNSCRHLLTFVFVLPFSLLCHWGCHFLVILDLVVANIVICLSFWWGTQGGRAGHGTEALSKWAHFPRHCHLFGVVLVSFWWCEGGRVTEICTFPEALSLVCYFGVIFCHCGGARREGGRGKAPNRNLHISRGSVICWSSGGARKEGGRERE